MSDQSKQAFASVADVSRRSFLKGVGTAGLVAGLLGAAEPKVAFSAEEAAVEKNPYTAIFGDEVNLLPSRRAVWDKSSGPIAFEGRVFDPSEITRVEDTELLVVGCGISGITAALRAAEDGARVIGIEKMSRGRNTWESIGGCGSRAQAANDNTPNPAEYAQALFEAGDWRVRSEVVLSFVANSGETIDFVQDMLDKADQGVQIYNTILPPSPYGVPVIQGEHKFSLPEERSWDSWIYGPAVMHALETTAATYQNLELRYRNSGVQLIQDGSGRVVGAIAKDENEGVYYQINASKGVILCTGGYEANPGMMESWTRAEDFATASCWDPSQGPTGDGHMMGLAIGAQMDPVPHPVMNFNFGTPAQFLDIPGIWFTAAQGIHVNANAKRFVNEALPMNYVSNAINIQPGRGKNCWIIFDQFMIDALADMQPTAAETIAQYQEKGWLYSAGTVEDLAKSIGLDADALKETVEEYNSYFDGTGTADPVFNRQLGDAMPLAEPPFYGLTTSSTVLTVVGGLVIDEHARVLDLEDRPIEGLYAAGNASGGMFAGTYPRHLPATSVGRAATFGYVAARHAVKGE